MKALKEKIQKTTTISSFVCLLIVLFGILLIELLASPGGILYQIERGSVMVCLYFLFIKIDLVFNTKHSANQRGIVITERALELKSLQDGKGMFLPVNERISILELEVKQENSKHHKQVIREASKRIGVALILSAILVLGVL